MEVNGLDDCANGPGNSPPVSVLTWVVVVPFRAKATRRLPRELPEFLQGLQGVNVAGYRLYTVQGISGCAQAMR
jgi:hypothetical protein